MPALCITSRSSNPNEGVSFVLSASGAFCMAVRVLSGILLLVLIHTSVVMECVANSSFPSRHQPLYLLYLLLALATICASLKGGWVLLFIPKRWVRRIQLSVAVRAGIRSQFPCHRDPTSS